MNYEEAMQSWTERMWAEYTDNLRDIRDEEDEEEEIEEDEEEYIK